MDRVETYDLMTGLAVKPECLPMQASTTKVAIVHAGRLFWISKHTTQWCYQIQSDLISLFTLIIAISVKVVDALQDPRPSFEESGIMSKDRNGGRI